MIDYRAIGRRMKTHRKKAQRTQMYIAEKLNVSDKYVSAVERGVSKMSLERIDEVADLLDITVVDLLSDCDTRLSSYGDSEILELIKEWSPYQKTILIHLIKSINDLPDPPFPKE